MTILESIQAAESRLDALVRAVAESCPAKCACPGHEALKLLVSSASYAVPTGQTAADDRALRTILFESDNVAWVNHDGLKGAEELVSRLAAKAQGYEAAVADNASLLDGLRDLLVPVRANRAPSGFEVARAMRLAGRNHPGAAVLKEREGQAETTKNLVEAIVFAETALRIGTIAARQSAQDKIDALRKAGVLPSGRKPE